VALLDDQIGGLLAVLEERFGENALVIFSADHGEMLGNHRLWGKNNCAYEDVWRVPLLVSFPSHTPEAERHGTASDAMVSLVDVAPTCWRAAGVDMPAGIDGAPLEEQMARGGRSHVIAEGEGFVAISDGRTKYVAATRGGRRYRELLDLEKDPQEHECVLGRAEYAERHLALAGTLEEVLVGAVLP
jgi:arylsulfatase A-like enzyme